MSQDSVYKPRVVIEGIEVVYLQSCNLKLAINTLNQMDASFSSNATKSTKLFGKKIELFLNAGAEDGFPIFSGYIKQSSINESIIKIKAIDVRGFLQDKAHSIELTDTVNYDGYTVGSFLKSYIIDNINVGKTLIDTKYLNDTTPKVRLSGMRGKFTPYTLVTKALEDNVDDNVLSDPLDYSIGVIGNGIIFIKKRLLDSTPSLSLSESDGIKSYNYSERVQNYTATYGNNIMRYGSNPSGPFSLDVKVNQEDDPAIQRTQSYIQLVQDLKHAQEIKVKASKGHYINVESIVWLEVRDSNISGAHRVTSKTINFSKGNLNLELGLSKKPIKVQDYI